MQCSLGIGFDGEANTGVLRFAQDDSVNEQRQRQVPFGNDNQKGKDNGKSNGKSKDNGNSRFPSGMTTKETKTKATAEAAAAVMTG